ncbi:fimbria/pilus outer membrane usher protein [Klebsiella quasipneumoniae]
MMNKISPRTYGIATRLLLVSVAVHCGIFYQEQSFAKEIYSRNLLELDNPSYKNVDLSAFNSGTQLPGNYRVDVVINNELIETVSLDFVLTETNNGQSSLQPCLSIDKLKQYGIKTQLYPGLKSSACANLSAIPQAAAIFKFNAQRLELTIPQAAMSRSARGAVSSEQYDEGISSLLLNYSVNGASNLGDKNNNNTQYANLRPGINIGPWRLRNYTTWNRDELGNTKWDTIYSYAQRNIVKMKAILTLGDSSSPSDIFESVPFRGIQIATDEDMLPESLRGYAPIVRGIARTNAQVVIRQNGYVVYDSYVPPGPFEINDLYPTGSGGDLDVTIKEANGSEQHMLVPYASVPMLQREGQMKYSLTGGQYRSYDHSVEKTEFIQGTIIYGLPYGLTAYSGMQGSDNYSSIALGTGVNMGLLGALSADVTQSDAIPQSRERVTGQSWRVRYSKNLSDIGTYFALAGYRYSTGGFRTLNEVMDSYRDTPASNIPDRKRNRAELSVSQRLWAGAGSLSVNAVSEDYWDSNDTMRSYGIGYNNSWKNINYSLNYTHNSNVVTASGGHIDRGESLFSLNVSIPLDMWMPNTWATYNTNHSTDGYTTHNVGLNGSALANRFNWNVQQGITSQGDGNNTTNLNGTYRGSYGELSGGYSYDGDLQRFNYGISGGVIAHTNGITFGQQLGETVALIKIPEAEGVDITNQSGVSTDFRGYAILPYLTPYRINNILINTETLKDDIELPKNQKIVVPTRGAVVRAEFAALTGNRVLITLLKEDKTPVPFGATVTNENIQSTESNIVGDGGEVFMSGLAQKGSLLVRWGNGLDQRCVVDYNLPQSKPASGVQTLNAICHR